MSELQKSDGANVTSPTAFTSRQCFPETSNAGQIRKTLVLPSHLGHFGIVVAEAMALSKPVLGKYLLGLRGVSRRLHNPRPIGRVLIHDLLQDADCRGAASIPNSSESSILTGEQSARTPIPTRIDIRRPVRSPRAP
jgi:hypothetical protein